MSVQAISWVLDRSLADRDARLVLIAIANHCDKFGCNAWPTVATIGAESRLSEREARYSLREREESGELTTERGKGPHRSNLYSLPKMKGAQYAPGTGCPQRG